MDPTREGGLDSYLQAIRAHWFLVVVVALATVAGTVAALLVRTPTYTATSKILVSPLRTDGESFFGLKIVRESGDPTRTVQTAASLIDTREAAELAAVRLGPGWTAQRVEDATTVQADGQSNLLAITAKAADPEVAARVADEYARSSLFVRRQELRVRVAALITQLQTRQRELAPGDPGAEDIARRINELESLRNGDDPTLQLAGSAAIPHTPSDPPAWLLLVVAVVGGLGVGSTAALLRETFTQAIRSEQDFRSIYPLPVLSRVPVVGESEHGLDRSAYGREAYRTVLAQILAGSSAPRAVMLTSPSVGDGKTTAAVQLALSAAASGMRVVLIDVDAYGSRAADRLGVPQEARRLQEAVAGDLPIDSLLAPVALEPSAYVLAASGFDTGFLATLQRRLPALLNDLLDDSADLVIVDAPPLDGGDSLSYAQDVDDVLLVVRLGHTRRSSIERTRDLLQNVRRAPTGAILVGDTKQLQSDLRELAVDGDRADARGTPAANA